MAPQPSCGLAHSIPTLHGDRICLFQATMLDKGQRPVCRETLTFPEYLHRVCKKAHTHFYVISGGRVGSKSLAI